MDVYDYAQLFSRYYTVSQKTDTDIAHQPILVIFGKNVTEKVCYQTVICYPTSPN